MNTTRKICVAAVAMCGVAACAPALLADEPYTIKYAEIKAVDGGYTLQMKAKKVSLKELLSELKADDLDTREDAIRAIEWPDEWPMADRKALIAAFGQRLSDPDEGIRLTAAEGLGRIGTDAVAVLPALMEATKDKEVLVRHRALRAIAEIGPKAKDAIPLMVEALEDENRFIRNVASLALGNIGPDAIPAVVKRLKNPKAVARREAARALAIMGTDANEALPALKMLLVDDDKDVAYEAQRAIKDIEQTPGSVVRSFPGKLKQAPNK